MRVAVLAAMKHVLQCLAKVQTFRPGCCATLPAYIVKELLFSLTVSKLSFPPQENSGVKKVVGKTEMGLHKSSGSPSLVSVTGGEMAEGR